MVFIFIYFLIIHLSISQMQVGILSKSRKTVALQYMCYNRIFKKQKNCLCVIMRYRLSLMKYAEQYRVTNAAVKYKTNQQYIYHWKHRFDDSTESVLERSRQPHSHPNPHTPQDIKLITDMRRYSLDIGLVVFWVKLRQCGYSCSIPGLYLFLRKQDNIAVHPRIPSISPNPISRCLILDNVFR